MNSIEKKLQGLGDIVAQAVPPLFFPSENEDVGRHQSSYSNTSGVLSNYDVQRTGRAIIFGSVIHAPCAHIHYNFLESLTVKAGISGLQIPVFKAFMEQVCSLFEILFFEIILVYLLTHGLMLNVIPVCILELVFKFTLSWCNGCNARSNIKSNI